MLSLLLSLQILPQVEDIQEMNKEQLSFVLDIMRHYQNYYKRYMQILSDLQKYLTQDQIVRKQIQVLLLLHNLGHLKQIKLLYCLYFFFRGLNLLFPMAFQRSISHSNFFWLLLQILLYNNIYIRNLYLYHFHHILFSQKQYHHILRIHYKILFESYLYQYF